ncbi:MAG TPA: methyl-accepting chemotaxis protein [Longimicrobium sp.]|nr:methyl-accepting chemotaxis protein [Longimicrobium sp.]
MPFRDLTIKGRLSLLVALLSFLLALTGIAGVLGTRRTQRALDDLYTNRVVPLRQLKTIADRYAVDIVDAAIKASYGSLTLPEALARVTAASRQIDSTWRAYVPSYVSQEEQRLITRVVPQMQAADSSVLRLRKVLAAGDVGALRAYVAGEMYPRIEPISATIDRISDLQLQAARKEYDTAAFRYRQLTRLISLCILVGLAAGITLGVRTVGVIGRALRGAVRVAERLARGDVREDVEVRSRDEVGQLLAAMQTVVESERAMAGVAASVAAGDLTADVTPRSPEDGLGLAFAAMSDRLAGTMGQVQAGAETLAEASAQLAATNQTLAHGAEEQAEGVERTAGELRSLGAAIGRTAQHAREMEALALEAAREAEASGRTVAEAVRAMRQIEGKVSLIEDLASQTNTLALVAGVEAARAGDEGRGFAEVAAEVRKLAERSRAATDEIDRMVDDSRRAAVDLGDRLGALVPTIRKTAELVGSVSATAQEQAAAVEQIAGSMEQVERVAADTAASTQEMAAMSEELTSQAAALEQLVAYFRTEEGEARWTPGPLPPPAYGSSGGRAVQEAQDEVLAAGAA